jgi:hypothetical protein
MASLARLSVRAAIATTLVVLIRSPVITYANIRLATDVNITQRRKALAAETRRYSRGITMALGTRRLANRFSL